MNKVKLDALLQQTKPLVHRNINEIQEPQSSRFLNGGHWNRSNRQEVVYNQSGP